MGWEALIPIIAQYGLPLAESLFMKWKAGGEPTQADFDELRQMAAQTATDRVKAAATSAGLDLNDPKVQELIRLAS